MKRSSPIGIHRLDWEDLPKLFLQAVIYFLRLPLTFQTFHHFNNQIANLLGTIFYQSNPSGIILISRKRKSNATIENFF